MKTITAITIIAAVLFAAACGGDGNTVGRPADIATTSQWQADDCRDADIHQIAREMASQLNDHYRDEVNVVSATRKLNLGTETSGQSVCVFQVEVKSWMEYSERLTDGRNRSVYHCQDGIRDTWNSPGLGGMSARQAADNCLLELGAEY